MLCVCVGGGGGSLGTTGNRDRNMTDRIDNVWGMGDQE